MKRPIACLLLIVLLLGGCSAFTREEKKDNEGWSEGSILRIGSQQIDYREGLVYLDATRREYERYYGPDIWGYKLSNDGLIFGNVVKAEVLESVIYLKLVCSKADDLNVCLTEDELRDADKRAAEYMKTLEGSKILEMGVNENVLRRVYSDNTLARKVFEQATFNINTNIPDEYAQQHRIYSIAVSKGRAGADDSESEKETVKDKLRKLKDSWMLSNDMYAFARSKTEDLTMADLALGTGELDDPALERELLGLRDGEFTDVLEYGDYYYIFYCKTAFDIDATQERKEEIIQNLRETTFEMLYEQWKEGTAVEVNRAVWDGIDMRDL